ncbi:ABC transporter ATP-binding protein [Amorphoplanes digitatis]|uniref:ATP-binding cassette subfamily B protein n=1 Tax=Actinoplanes digitatis TaxID=1868 RepID=A0A7W7HVC3_9ACTN|nr:ABC transporter ATP-binding protein [Actinoplanes digitatis]MBB4761458.1 ATP-binding cassette subfamily B protein [Actinoplanes digitatis]GID97696.1 multidrug ABC transporter ATP-binding protein [Actinoplanes digitatis]
MGLLRLLRARVTTYRGALLLLVLLQVAQTAALLALPALSADVIDNGVMAGDRDRIVSTGLIMVATAVLQATLSVVAVWRGTRFATAVGSDLRAAVFRRTHDLSVHQAARFGTSSLVTRTVNDVQQVQELILTTLNVALAAPFVCAGATLLAMRSDVPLAWLITLIVPAVSVTATIILARMSPLYARMQAGLDGIGQVLREQITGVRVVRAFVRDAHERRRFALHNAALLDVQLRVGRLTAAMFPAVLLVMNLFTVALLYAGAVRIDDGRVEVGTLNAFLGYQALILMATVAAMLVFLNVPRAGASARRIVEVLDSEPGVSPPAEPRPPGDARLLEIRSARFGYPGAERPILDGIDLVAGPGETVAVVGSTGAGKTTLLNLAVRLLDVSAGAIRVNGVDVRELSPGALSRLVGLVPQTPYLFSGTVATNLRFGNPAATDAELWRALEVAQAREFVEAMPGGLHAPLSQGGTNVSGGQRQRLAIARTVARRPQIYLFDDCFSALDAATDAAVRSALEVCTAGAIVLVVAQRISSVRHAHRILVLDRGRLVGAGTHDELLARNDTYREIAASQLEPQAAR